MILLIFEVMDEDSKLYLIEDLSEEEERILRLAHGNYINTSVDSTELEDALDKVSDALCDKEEYASDPEWACRWTSNEVECGESGYLEEPITLTEIVRVGMVW